MFYLTNAILQTLYPRINLLILSLEDNLTYCIWLIQNKFVAPSLFEIYHTNMEKNNPPLHPTWSANKHKCYNVTFGDPGHRVLSTSACGGKEPIIIEIIRT